MDLEHAGFDGREFSRSWARTYNRLILALLLSALGAAPIVSAQAGYDTATLRGTILDQQGATVASATVTIKNAATGFSKSQKAEADGTFQLPALPPGTYDVAVEASGFSKAVTAGLVLTVGATVTYDVHLKVGQVREVVEVSDRPPLIDTEQSQQANTVDTR